MLPEGRGAFGGTCSCGVMYSKLNPDFKETTDISKQLDVCKQTPTCLHVYIIHSFIQSFSMLAVFQFRNLNTVDPGTTSLELRGSTYLQIFFNQMWTENIVLTGCETCIQGFHIYCRTCPCRDVGIHAGPRIKPLRIPTDSYIVDHLQNEEKGFADFFKSMMTPFAERHGLKKCPISLNDLK